MRLPVFSLTTPNKLILNHEFSLSDSSSRAVRQTHERVGGSLHGHALRLGRHAGGVVVVVESSHASGTSVSRCSFVGRHRRGFPAGRPTPPAHIVGTLAWRPWSSPRPRHGRQSPRGAHANGGGLTRNPRRRRPAANQAVVPSPLQPGSTPRGPAQGAEVADND